MAEVSNIVSQVKAQFEGRINTLNTEINSKTQKLADLEKKLTVENMKLKVLQTTLAKAEGDLQANIIRLNNTKRIKVSLRNTIKGYITDNQRTVAQAKSAIEAQIGIVRSIENQKKDLQEDIRELRSNLSSVQNEFDSAIANATSQDTKAVITNATAERETSPEYWAQQTALETTRLQNQAELEKNDLELRKLQEEMEEAEEKRESEEELAVAKSERQKYMLFGGLALVFVIIIGFFLTRK